MTVKTQPESRPTLRPLPDADVLSFLYLEARLADEGLIEEELSYSVIGAFYEVYNTLGYGFLEHIYTAALEQELIARGHTVQRELTVHVHYKGRLVGTHPLDMVVDDKLTIENKATHMLLRRDTRQLYNYLKATRFEVGLLLHFGPEPGFHRIICRNSKKSFG